MWRIFATFYAFIILGANDAAYGALIPYLEIYYNVTYTVISLVFLAPVVGYVTSAFMLNQIHVRFGQRGIAIMGPGSHLIAYIIVCVHPPYPVLVIVLILAGFGNGLQDGAWNAWLGDFANANEILGFLHGFYGLGAALSPLIATTLVTKAGWQWFEFYYIMVGGAIIECFWLMITFWKADGATFQAAHPRTTPPSPTIEGQQTCSPNNTTDEKPPAQGNFVSRFIARRSHNSPTAEAVTNKVTWLASFFLLVYVGIEVSVGGWVVTFMMRVRHGTPFASGLTSTGFWAGITLGRVILGFVTGRCFRTEKHAIATYLVLSVVLELLFWLVPQFVVSAVMVAFMGFFLGPMFPAAIVALSKLLPKHLHVAAVGFSAAFGSAGACILPFAVGAIAQSKGVKVLQPIVLAMLVVALGIWVLIPKLPKVRTV